MITISETSLSVGTIEYIDTGGDLPVLLFVHGLLMDETLWSDVVADLRGNYRCVVPVLPLGAHRQALAEFADLSLSGIARILIEFIERLGLNCVTIIGNDTGGAVVQLVMAARPAHITRAVLVSCDAFDNVPPGLTGKTIVLTGKLSPALFGAFMQQMRIRPLRRLPIAFGWLTKRGDRVTRAWLTPILTQRAIRKDAVKALRAIGENRSVLINAINDIKQFDQPVLIVWARHDRVMPPEHAGKLAELFANARVIEIDDSYTLVPLDQPHQLSEAIRAFARADGGTGAGTMLTR